MWGNVSTYINGKEYKWKGMRGNQGKWKEGKGMKGNAGKWSEKSWQEMKWTNTHVFWVWPPIKHISISSCHYYREGVTHTTHFGNSHYLKIDKQQPQQVESLYSLTPLWIAEVISLFFSSSFVKLPHATSMSRWRKGLLLSDRNLGKNGIGSGFLFHVMTFCRVWSTWFPDSGTWLQHVLKPLTKTTWGSNKGSRM